MKKADFLIIGIAIILAGVFFLFTINGKRGDTAQVLVDGEVVAEYTLDAEVETRIETDNGFNVLKIHNGKVSVSEADCDNQICVRHTEISKSGESIICLPHKLMIRITGSGEEADAIIN